MSATTWDGLIRFCQRFIDGAEIYDNDTDEIVQLKQDERQAFHDRIILIERIRNHPEFQEIIPGTIVAIMTLWLPGQEKAIFIGQPEYPKLTISLHYLTTYDPVIEQNKEVTFSVPLDQAVDVLVMLVKQMKQDRRQLLN